MEAKHRAMHLTFSIEDRNGNDVTCPSEHSPDSMRSSSSLSCGSSDSPPDVEMEDCVSDATSRGSLKTREPISNTTFVCPKKEETSSSKIVVKSSGAINVDFVKSKIDNWNENMALLIANPKNSVVGGTECSESGGDETCGRSSDASPDCREGELSEMESCEPSRRGSSENCCSVSSGEMVMRGNSFILHETDQPLSISLLGESKTSLDISSDLAVISGMLPDVCEGICEDRPAETPHGRPKGLERTFHIQSNNQTIIIEGDLFPMPLSSSDPQKETEDKDLQLSTDKCLTPIHHHSSNKDFQKLCNTGGSNQSTPVEGKTVLLTASEDLDISGDAQTSTPVQSVSNKTFHLPPLSESPLNKDEGDSVSPMAQVINRQRVATSQKAKMPLMAASKSSKIEIKRFPKPNFSNIKSKIMSRPTNPFKTSRVSIPKSSSSSTSQDNENQTTDQSAQLKSFPTTSVSSTVINNSAAPAESTRSSNVAKRTRSSTFQESGPAPKSRPRRWSESGSLSKTSKDGSQEQNLQVNGGLTCETPRTLSKRDSQSQGGKTKPVDGRESSKEDSQGNESPRNRGKNPKVSLLAVSGRTTTTTTTAVAACEWSRGRLGPQPSPARTGGASAAHVPAANLRQTLSATSKLKPGTGGKDGLNTTDVPTARRKLSTPDVKLKIHPTDGTSAVSGGAQSRPLAAPPTSASKLLLKPKILPKSSSSSSQTSGHPKQDHSVPSAAASGKTPSCRALFRNKLQGQPARPLSSGCKNTSGQSSARPSRSPLKTPTSARPSRPAGTLTVDKNKSRATFRNQQPPTNGHPDLVPAESKSRSVEYYKALCEKKNQTIQQLENVVRANNRRFEAVAVVIKHFYSEHEEVMKQRRDISQELVTLREELVNSAQSCERLEQQKDELRAAFDGVLQKVQEQHRLDLAELEERLKTFYSSEWEKVHHTYQEEADKCRAQMEQQLEELQSKHEALKKEIEVSHLDEVQRLKQQFEESFKEFQQSHEEEMLTFNTSMKESEETLSSQIQELITENNILKEKLKAEERRRSDLAEKSQKDCHTLYLEQELESLKVVLDIKNKQIHEQDKKLMQIDKLMERNVKLDECLKKVQQENEDLKARMDKHAALSRQLSTEQAVLQESLQKESKVNKRLSMENEELLWKLHNGDLSSPRKISPSPSLTLQSPRNSGMFSSPPVSPR